MKGASKLTLRRVYQKPTLPAADSQQAYLHRRFETLEKGAVNLRGELLARRIGELGKLRIEVKMNLARVVEGLSRLPQDRGLIGQRNEWNALLIEVDLLIGPLQGQEAKQAPRTRESFDDVRMFRLPRGSDLSFGTRTREGSLAGPDDVSIIRRFRNRY